MKKDKNFWSLLMMITFIITFVVSFVLSGKTIKVCGLTATASVIIYPLTYFLATIFCERWGKNNTFVLFVYSIFALIFASILLALGSSLPSDITEFNFKVDFQLMFALITSFLIGQSLNLILYYYLNKERKISFLVSSVIAITFDSLIFVMLLSIGKLPVDGMFKMFSGQFIISVMIMFIYSFLFSYIIPTVISTKPVETVKLEEKKKTRKTTKKESKN